jgi:hypothetical protein
MAVGLGFGLFGERRPFGNDMLAHLSSCTLRPLLSAFWVCASRWLAGA